jgi:hypothetical protein
MATVERNPGEWLIGIWEGAFQIPNQALLVTNVRPGGFAEGMFGATGRAAKAQIAMHDSQVNVTSSVNNVLLLNRTGPEELEGTFTQPNGEAFPIKLSKKESTITLVYVHGFS